MMISNQIWTLAAEGNALLSPRRGKSGKLFGFIIGGPTDELHSFEEEEKLALFMKRIINFQQMVRCKGVLLREGWR